MDFPRGGGADEVDYGAAGAEKDVFVDFQPDLGGKKGQEGGSGDGVGGWLEGEMAWIPAGWGNWIWLVLAGWGFMGSLQAKMD